MPMTYIKENLAATKAQLAAAMQEAGRQDGCVVLAAVKYAVPGEIEALLDAGVTDVGENRVQQLLDNAALYAARDVRVHFIGSLQTNKVKYIVDKVCMIHSLDSDKLALEIEKRAAQKGRVIDVLVEIEFDGSLPAFVAAFAKRQNISEEELDEVQRMIDRIRKGG